MRQDGLLIAGQRCEASGLTIVVSDARIARIEVTVLEIRANLHCLARAGVVGGDSANAETAVVISEMLGEMLRGSPPSQHPLQFFRRLLRQ